MSIEALANASIYRIHHFAGEEMYVRAEEWMNEQAAEGYRLSCPPVYGAGLLVVMEKNQ